MNNEQPGYFRRSVLARDVADKIEAGRQAAGISRRVLARRASISYCTLGRIVRGERRPSPESLRKIALALGTTMEHFCNAWGEVEIYRPRYGSISLGIGLRELRIRAGVSLNSAAAAANVSISTLSRFERNIHKFPRGISAPDSVGKLSEAGAILICDDLAKLFGFVDAKALTVACADVEV